MEVMHSTRLSLAFLLFFAGGFWLIDNTKKLVYLCRISTNLQYQRMEYALVDDEDLSPRKEIKRPYANETTAVMIEVGFGDKRAARIVGNEKLRVPRMSRNRARS